MSSSDPIDHMSVSERLQRLATPSAPAEDDVDVDADGDGATFRDIHPSPAPAPLRQPSWDVASQRSLSSYSDEQFMSSMGREFTAMVDAGGAPADPCPGRDSGAGNNDLQLARIGEHEPVPETETNPLAIVADTGRPLLPSSSSCAAPAAAEVVEVRQVKKEEAEAKVAAWQAEEVAKINNKFKREEVVINGWENQQIHTATTYLSKIERKLEEERAKATEKAQNEVARARRKAEEKRASAEAARGTKTARVMDLANFMKAVGRLPTKRSFFSFSSSS
ncbi:remorin 4.1 [Aegilops tauschii subsp. strangulata]|uniref:Remorin C-terminal domain-containing protein n=3 Tax=Triticinae TaxID=1648030 RepID=A0A453STI3_AEGTS|nr:remorin 4.1 [Aegilops tauschii subsp. strangulata]XP_044441782.1 remorin 4.1-like [Triticum aestivum]